MKFLFSVIAFAMASTSFAQIKIPDMSPRAHITQKVGLTSIDLDYSRPNARGRNLFSNTGVIPFNQKWRTGANAATWIESDKDILVNGQSLPQGKYAILITPSIENWKIHFYEYNSGNWTSYLKKEPILEVNSAVHSTHEYLESMFIYFDAITLKGADLNIWWGNTQVKIPITADSHKKILANIEKELAGPSSFDYFLAALYLHETQTDLPKALNYVQKATQGDDARFFQVYREALILKDLGRNKEAVEASKRSRILAVNAGNDDFVRLLDQLLEELQ